MINSLSVKGYRCLESFSLSSLTRINLLVGKNNSGKTAVLEALEILGYSGAPVPRVWSSVQRRGELIVEEEEDRAVRRDYDLRHLFTGHKIAIGSTFSVSGTDEFGKRDVVCEIVANKPDMLKDTLPFETEISASYADSPMGFIVKTESTASSPVPLSALGGLSIDYARRFAQWSASEERGRAAFVTPTSLTADKVARLWQEITLTPEEPVVIKALQLVEPTVEKLAYVGSSRQFRMERGGMAVKFAGIDQRLPIGSLGDGAWRILAVTLALIRSRGGMLLVDEIDTGLHYSVLGDMWKVIMETAEHLNVQVFATTHSSDCVSSLASASKTSGSNRTVVLRMEKNEGRAVPFTEDEVGIAAERGLEIR